MAGSGFIRTVIYGGYDKADVIRRLDYLYQQVYSLENELRETKLLLDSSKNADDIRNGISSVLAEERARLTEVMAENETLTIKLKTAEEENKKCEAEINKLNEALKESASKLTEVNTRLAAAQSGDDAAALSAVFIEAKRSADMLEENAREKAAQLEKSAAKAAEKSIAYANDEGAIIINEAERRAAEIIADAKNAESEMSAAYDNMRAAIMTRMVALGERLNDFKDAIRKFEESGVGNLYECEEILGKTEETLNEGGVPEFRQAERFDPDYPERPKRKADPDSEENQKRKSKLDKLRQMAESLTAAKTKAESPASAEEKTEPDASDDEAAETVSHDEQVTEASAPDKSAEKAADDVPEPETSEDTKTETPDNNTDNNKSGKVDLASLVKQAKSLKDK